MMDERRNGLTQARMDLTDMKSPTVADEAADELVRDRGWQVEPMWLAIGRALEECCPKPVSSVEDYINQGPRRLAQHPEAKRDRKKPDKGMPRNALFGAAALLILVAFALGYSVAASSGAPATRYMVRFSYVADQASSVAVVGDFNRWDRVAGQMERRQGSGAWEKWLLVPEGRHRYVFVVDGGAVVDPAAAERAVDAKGRQVGVLVTGGTQPK